MRRGVTVESSEIVRLHPNQKVSGKTGNFEQMAGFQKSLQVKSKFSQNAHTSTNKAQAKSGVYSPSFDS